jgi:transposase InsO family protein
MRTAGLQGKSHCRKRAKTTDSTHDQPRASNHLNQKFDASNTNLVWVSGITCLDTTQGWLFLCVVLDVCSRKVVGWAFSLSLEACLVVNALELVVQTRKLSKSLMFYEVQVFGWFWQHLNPQQPQKPSLQVLTRKRTTPALTRAGACLLGFNRP